MSTTKDVQISTKVSKDLYSAMLSIQARILKETGFKPTVSDVARKLLQDGIDRESKRSK